jgi:glycosyltransferase involved in cell wall biosynthesis
MEIIPKLILIIFVLATGINLYFWLTWFSKLAFYNPVQTTDRKEEDPPLVSIVICARNEEENLEKNLRRFLNQTYRSIEIVLVDDQSTDKSLERMWSFQKTCSTFRIIIIRNANKNHAGKKEALAKGIGAATGKIILLTDADCIPANEEWVSQMVKLLNGEVDIVLGYSPYQKEKGFLNKFIRFETVYTAIQYLSFALAGKPYMGVGRNLMYRKKLFEKSDQFKTHLDIPSGDDDLFINSVSNSTNTVVSLSPQTFVLSEPSKSWEKYYTQKARHLSTGSHYKWSDQIKLALLSGTHLLHYMGGIVLLYINSSTIFVFLLFVLRISVVWYIYRGVLNRLEDKSLLKWIPLLDACLVLYYLIFIPSLLIKRKTKKWN